MRLPSRENAASRPSWIRVGFVPSGFAVQTPLSQSYMIRVPSGEKDGRNPVSATVPRFEPSTFTTLSQPPLEKMILLPSGDQAGVRPKPCVSWVAPVPSALTTIRQSQYVWVPRRYSTWRTIFFPSEDQAGSPPQYGQYVSPVPSGLMNAKPSKAMTPLVAGGS